MSFPLIEPPLFARGNLDRADELRTNPARLAAGWATAQLVTIDPRGCYPTDGTKIAWTATETAEVNPDAVFLGVLNGIDHWALRVPEITSKTGHPMATAQLLSPDDAGLLITALGILNWADTQRFSSSDGLATTAAHAGWVRVTTEGKEEFPRTDSAIITAIHDGADHILLGRQKNWPENVFSTLAGFVEPGESLEQCVIRECHEEVGLTVENPQYLGSQPWPFPRSLMIGFIATANRAQPLNFIDGEISDARWFHRDEIITALRENLPSNSPTEIGKTAVPQLVLPSAVSISRALINVWAHN